MPSHPPSVRRLLRITSHHPWHFRHIDLSLSRREQVEVSGVATEATRAGFSVALSGIGCVERDVLAEYVTIYRECGFQAQQSFLAMT